MSKSKIDKQNPRYKKYRKTKIIFIIEIIVLVLTVLFGAAYLFVSTKLNKIQSSEMDMDKVEINNQVQTNKSLTGYTNIALFGLDTREADLSRANSDAIIIASINNDTSEVKLVSIYRDTYLYIGGDLYRKANAAYANGGPERAVSMLNTDFDLNISDYISVDFNALSELVDLLEGISLTVDEQEYVHLNNYCVETSKVTGKSYTNLPGAGTYTMNGVQATSYARIRYTEGNDFKRTERQREVIEKIVEKAKKSSISTLNDVMDDIFPMIKTSLTQGEIISMGLSMMSYKISETIGFPYDLKTGGKGGSGDDEVPQTLESNVVKLHKFLFNVDNYEPSSRVKELSDNIITLTGVQPKEENAEAQSDSGQTEESDGAEESDGVEESTNTTETGQTEF